ncbi:MAG: hypothetical protein HOP34_16860 [Methylococcaceae bacterium]|nr:hypothetical protein [Methylococcaceae bacterium]
MSAIELCPNPQCLAEISWVEDRCLSCFQPLAPPNQRLANRDYETDALQQRYQAAVKDAELRGVSYELAGLEQAITDHSLAAINCSVKFLHGFLTDNNPLYANYRQQTESATRKVAELNNDRQRVGTEGILYGSLAAHISYAALTVDKKGLISYGNCVMLLKDLTMANKATVLDENSYDFVRRHKILPGDRPPAGYWASWHNRHRLAIAKLAEKVKLGSKDYAALLLKSNGNRAEDEFIEVHIYGSFDKQAIAELALPGKAPKAAIERVLLDGIKDYANHHAITCTDYD